MASAAPAPPPPPTAVPSSSSSSARRQQAQGSAKMAKVSTTAGPQKIQHFYDRCVALRDLIRQLRQNALNIHRMLLDPNVSTQKINQLLIMISRLLDTLEMHTKNTSDKIPNVDKIGKIVGPLYAYSTMDVSYKRHLDTAEKSLSWMEESQQRSHFMSEFLKLTMRKKGLSMAPRPVPYTNFSITHPQHNFENIFGQVQKQFAATKMMQQTSLRYLEQNCSSAIVELKCTTTVEKQVVTTMKMAILINNGSPDYVQFIGPHEDWQYQEDVDRKSLVVDLSKESKYLVFRKLTVQGNLHLQQMMQQNFELKSPGNLSQLFLIFARFHQVFEAQCKNCRRVMKDFLPPLIFDIRAPKTNALHESCR